MLFGQAFHRTLLVGVSMVETVPWLPAAATAVSMSSQAAAAAAAAYQGLHAPWGYCCFYVSAMQLLLLLLLEWLLHWQQHL
jgi:hypothetical protein